ncbi:MAG: hypothetical protein AAFO95_17915 [Cyanobacteria bacterium J06600_6]
MFKSAKLVSNAAHFHGDDLVDWSIIDAQSTLSPEFPPPFPEYTNQLTFYSANKQEIRVAVPTGKISRINQNHFFPGTFNIGEKLLFSGFSNPGPLSFEFSKSLYGIGINIQSDPQVPSGTPAPFPFTALVKVFAHNHQNLGQFELAGLSQIAAGSGTTFIGLTQEEGEIAQVTIEVIENGNSIPFALNTLRLKTYSLVPAQGFQSIRAYVTHFAQ